LGIDSFTYSDLYDAQRLQDLALAFDGYVETRDAELFTRFDTYRHAVQSGTEHGGLTTPEESALLIEAGRYLAMFLSQLFPLDGGPASLKTHAERDALVARFKKEFVTKRVAKVQSVSFDAKRDELVQRLLRSLAGGVHDRELA